MKNLLLLAVILRILICICVLCLFDFTSKSSFVNLISIQTFMNNITIDVEIHLLICSQDLLENSITHMHLKQYIEIISC